jgi:hypothetical protein
VILLVMRVNGFSKFGSFCVYPIEIEQYVYLGFGEFLVLAKPKLETQ